MSRDTAFQTMALAKPSPRPTHLSDTKITQYRIVRFGEENVPEQDRLPAEVIGIFFCLTCTPDKVIILAKMKKLMITLGKQNKTQAQYH